MWRWIVAFWRWLFSPQSPAPSRTVVVAPRLPLGIPRYDGLGDPPRRHWKPCHPRTVQRFKAHMTCDEGHSIVLKDHTIHADGRVHPSVVCRAPGCRFHDFVRLTGWTGGELA